MEDEVRKGVEEKLRGRIIESPVLIKRVDRSQKPVWDLTVTFSRIQGENEDEVTPIDTIHVTDRKWKVGGVEWLIRNGDHCSGCHGRGHSISRCPLRPHVAPFDRYEDPIEDGAKEWPIEAYLESHPHDKKRFVRRQARRV